MEKGRRRGGPFGGFGVCFFVKMAAWHIYEDNRLGYFSKCFFFCLRSLKWIFFSILFKKKKERKRWPLKRKRAGMLFKHVLFFPALHVNCERYLWTVLFTQYIIQCVQNSWICACLALRSCAYFPQIKALTPIQIYTRYTSSLSDTHSIKPVDRQTTLFQIVTTHQLCKNRVSDPNQPLTNDEGTWLLTET